MLKYRRLSKEELSALEKEFVEFLILNGIDAADWEKLKKENIENAEQIIDQFSDVVFEGILRKIEYLENRLPKELLTFQCLKDKIVLVAMKASEDSDADFTDQTFLHSAMLTPPDGLKVYTREKAYDGTREQELFSMLNQGCLISDGKLFKTLCIFLV